MGQVCAPQREREGKAMRRHLVLVGFLIGASAPAVGQSRSFYYSNFDNTSAFTFAGNAAPATVAADRKVLRLVPVSRSSFHSGAAYLTIPVSLGPKGAFETAFSFHVHSVSTTQWADGFTFVAAASPVGLGAPSAYGGYLGYLGVANSLAIEFDTYYNNQPGTVLDAAPNEVAVDTDGSVTVIDNPRSSWGQPYGQGNCEGFGKQPVGCMTDGKIWTAHITYDGSVINVTVRDGSNPAVPVVTNYPVNLISLLGSTTAYVGFTAGNADSQANFDVLGWGMRY